MSEKKWSEIVLEERDKGNIVFLCVDEVMVAPVKEIIKQPAEGLLWDLNRDGVTALSFMDEEGMIHWVNNFAVALVIRELKSQLDQLETRESTARAIMEKFIFKVDEGLARSKETYAEMKAWLDGS